MTGYSCVFDQVRRGQIKKFTHSQCSRVIDNQIMQRVEEHESVVLQSSELCLI